MEEETTRNAVIRSAQIAIEDHGYLTAWLSLEWDGAGQAFGGYGLHSSNNKFDHAGRFIFRVLQVVGVDDWEKLKGKAIRIRHTHDKVSAIGNIVKEDWFSPATDLKAGAN